MRFDSPRQDLLPGERCLDIDPTRICPERSAIAVLIFEAAVIWFDPRNVTSCSKIVENCASKTTYPTCKKQMMAFQGLVAIIFGMLRSVVMLPCFD